MMICCGKAVKKIKKVNTADSIVCDTISTIVFNSKLVEKENICDSCVIMKAELDELKSEISSCKEIIRILQEELRGCSTMSQPVWKKANEDHKGKVPVNSSVHNGWSQCSSNRRRKPQQIRRNLQQLPIQTSNMFQHSVNLNDGNKYPRCSAAADLTQVPSNYMTKHQGLSQSVKK